MRKSTFIVTMVFLLSLNWAILEAQHHTLELNEVSRFAYSVCGSGSNRKPYVNYPCVYFPDSYGLQICLWDSLTNDWSVLANLGLPGNSWELTGDDAFVYVAVDYTFRTDVTADMPKLMKVDVRDPHNPFVVGQINAGENQPGFSHLEIVNGVLLASRTQQGAASSLVLIDPNTLEVMHEYPGYARYSILPGNRIITRRSDARPFQIFSVSLQDGLSNQVDVSLQYEVNVFPAFVLIHDNILVTHIHNEIRIWDMSATDSWDLLSTMPYGSVYPAVMCNDYLVIHGWPQAGSPDTLRVFDVSDPVLPTQVYSQEFPPETHPFYGGYYSMAAYGSTVFVHGGAQKYFQMEVDDTGESSYIGSCYERNSIIAAGRVVDDIVLTPTVWEGLVCYDISDASAPVEVYSLFDGCSMQIEIHGDLLYADMIDMNDSFAETERIYDITDLQNPQLLYSQEFSYSNSLFFNPLEPDVFYRFNYQTMQFEKRIVSAGAVEQLWTWSFPDPVLNHSFADNILYGLGAPGEGDRDLYAFGGFSDNTPNLVEHNVNAVPSFARLNRAGNFVFLHDTGSSPVDARFFNNQGDFSVDNDINGFAGEEFAGVGHETYVSFYDLTMPLSGFLEADTVLPQNTMTAYAHWNDEHVVLFQYGCVAIFEYSVLNSQSDVPECSTSLTAFPNPFNPATTIRFDLPEPCDVTLEVFNIRGQLVATLAEAPMSAESHEITWDASGQASGVYFARLEAGSVTEVKKLLLLK